ncbi:hypothetical protein C6501_00635 [Candidatus Poribacteria bacterium]|nr:MAG: hypothetical protein C6501_00635 [Candidatus Poribacteria bacterium]
MRVQYSVFEAHLNKTQFEELKQAVIGVIDSSDPDSVCVLCYYLHYFLRNFID